MLAALVSRQKVFAAPAPFFYRLYALHQILAKVLLTTWGSEIAALLSPIQFLNPRVINHHSKKAASRQQWIDFSEASGRNALPPQTALAPENNWRYSCEKPLGQLVLLQRAIQQQSRERLIFRAALQHFKPHPREYFQIVSPASRFSSRCSNRRRGIDLPLDHCPVKILFTREVPKDQRLVTPDFSAINLVVSPEIPAPQTTGRDIKNLLATIGREKTGLRCCHGDDRKK